MSKAILISIRPEWCEKIASGEKTIEVRKTRPKIEAPFKCYIYESYGGNEYYKFFHEKTIGKVIGEFVCDNVGLYHYGGAFSEKRMCFSLRVCSGLSIDELKKYAHGKDVYGWHISDLVIYDKPKELNEFIRPGSLRGEELDDHICLYCDLGDKRLDNSCEKAKCSEAYIEYLTYENFVIDRPPQSWCYVEKLK